MDGCWRFVDRATIDYHILRMVMLHKLILLALSPLAVLGLAGCPAHENMTVQQTIDYHCEKNDHGARWLAGYGDGTSQLNNFEGDGTQYRLTGTPDDRCFGAFTRLDGKRIIIGYDVNYYNEKIVRVWIASEYWPSGAAAVTEFADPSLANAKCYDTTDGQKADAQAAGVTLPPDCYSQLPAPGGSGETVAQFLALDPSSA